MSRRPPVRPARLALAGVWAGVWVVVLALVVGCSGPASPGAAATAPPAASARVGLTDFAVHARPVTVLPGTVVLHATNAGATLHDLVVRGQAGEWRTVALRPGEQAGLVVQARPGEELELWCSVGGHDAAGMRSTLRVAQEAR